MQQLSFVELGVSPTVAETLARRGITEPFAVQGLVLPDALAGRDVLAKSRTGSGKTLAFAIPIVERLDSAASGPVALVLVPTRELASQVAQEFSDIARAKGLRIACVYGGVPLPAQAKIAARAHILVATPGRMEDLAARGLVRLGGVTTLILDEADRMLDMGFQPQVTRILNRLPRDRQTMFFSATLDGEVGHLAKAMTKNAQRHEVQSPRATVDEVDHRFMPVTDGGKVKALAGLLEGESGRILVFVRTKRGADRLVRNLRSLGVTAAGMHGDMTQAAREKTLARFESGKVRTLVATDVAARGLDVEGISHVINYDPPGDHKDYVHRVGRTARAGRSGSGVTLVLPDQTGDVGRIARQLELKDEFEREGMKMAAPQVVYRSRPRSKSLLARPRRRSF